MKNYIVYLIMMLITYSSNSLAEANKNTDKKVKAKCFVELYGGKKTIVYQIVKETQFSQVSKRLVNKSMMTTLADKKQKIYQVIECAKGDDDFINKDAIGVEKVTAR
ncbi:TapY2 family type IVa secretion system protein [Colwelliaceae bacterium 6441]